MCEATGNVVHRTGGKPSATAASNVAVQRGNAAPMVPVVALYAPSLCLDHQGKPGVLSGTVVKQGSGKRVCGCS